MLIRNLACLPSEQSLPAFEEFVKAEASARSPVGLLCQSEHSRLAGAIAGSLDPSAFGELNQDVIAAIAHHDYGWDQSDQWQLNQLPGRMPVPFTKVSASDTLPCWLSSIAYGRRLGLLAAVLISRHCCLLGTGSEEHAQFLAAETHRRHEIECWLTYSRADLDRWTAALGFCDLLSLYLCSGSRSPVMLALKHPATPGPNRPDVCLTWNAGQPVLSQPLLCTSSSLQARGLRYDARDCKTEPLTLEWTFRQLEAKGVQPNTYP